MRGLKEGRRVLERDPTLRRIVEVIVRVLNPDGIILFGSRARGDYDDYSDYDILVLKRGIKPEERRKLEGFIELELAKERIFHSADITVQSPERYEILKRKVGLVYKEISREGVVLYEKRRGKAMA